eukprot:TRINITY_DN2750_c0_g1_i6.p1 TRINITY_DN2750_c0_g1~~TRINITY_DN2750_c0_g1_i6.p1  ORF type:complete len:167 (-),score=18.75 TRINITY_DN2750_c0_g1_i6:187-687(-)
MDITTEDWVHQDVAQYNVTYFLNVCADVIEVPAACKRLQKLSPAPAFQVSANGQCHSLGTLKTFQWKPLDTNKPDKGMVLTYKNGDLCGTGGQRMSIRYVFTCSRNYDKDAGPMVRMWFDFPSLSVGYLPEGPVPLRCRVAQCVWMSWFISPAEPWSRRRSRRHQC